MLLLPIQLFVDQSASHHQNIYQCFGLGELPLFIVNHLGFFLKFVLLG
jgi:hypothetical protein